MPRRAHKKMVPRRGLEPPRPCERQHLKLVRLPIPPSGHGVGGAHYWAAIGLSTAPAGPSPALVAAPATRHGKRRKRKEACAYEGPTRNADRRGRLYRALHRAGAARGRRERT